MSELTDTERTLLRALAAAFHWPYRDTMDYVRGKQLEPTHGPEFKVDVADMRDGYKLLQTHGFVP